MRLLLGISGDDRSLEVLDWAIERAAAAGDDLTVALVERTGTDADRESTAETVRERLRAADLEPDVRILDGDAGGALVALSERGAYDQLAIPGKGKSPMGKIDLDRLEEYVLLNCTTTVTIVR